jgi:hypothetical protein
MLAAGPPEAEENMTQQQQIKILVAALAVLGGLIAYRMASVEAPRTAPLAFPPGSVSHSAVRRGLAASSDAAPLNVFLARRAERFPGVLRDIFRMEQPASKAKPAPVLAPPPAPPAVVERTPEEIAADLSRAELAKFRFIGYLTEKDSTLFLSKDGELFIVKSRERFLAKYQVKQASAEYVVLLDTSTDIERRIALSGSGDAGQPQPPGQQQAPPRMSPQVQPASPPQPPAPPRAAPQVQPASPPQPQQGRQPPQTQRWNRPRPVTIQPGSEQ